MIGLYGWLWTALMINLAALLSMSNAFSSPPADEANRPVEKRHFEEKTFTTSGSTVAVSSVPSLEVTDDTASQSSQQMLDILWVVDNSKGMVDVQRKLSTAILESSAQLKGLRKKGLDVRMAMTSSDVCKDIPSAACPEWGYVASYYHRDYSALRGRLASMIDLNNGRSDRPALRSFANQIKMGTQGSGAEHPLSATWHTVMQKPKNFLRPGAHWAVMIVSNEDDSGLKMAAYNQTYYRFGADDLIANIGDEKGDENFSIHGIVAIPGRSNCVKATQHAHETIRAIQATNGFVGNICAPQLTSPVSRFFTRLQRQLTRPQVLVSATSSINSHTKVIQAYRGGIE